MKRKGHLLDIGPLCNNLFQYVTIIVLMIVQEIKRYIMSTLKVDAIRHNSATSDAITTASDGTCTAKLTSVGGGGLSHRNIVINGG